MLAILLLAATAAASPTGNDPVEPFRIVGNVYYVGASDVTSYLIATPKGHIVLDGGFAQTAPMIVANIRKLGFDPRDVRLILNSHAHLDHAGGIAELRRVTGAKFLASAPDAGQLARGGTDDPQFGN
ncbi:MAG TPA: MBL fold metallo-hydrolase, partial [Thermoanaerobaculia bacterium]|nr:MBL fold metallo-hydrolase [Thermoanaerobaculia bacterium]